MGRTESYSRWLALVTKRLVLQIKKFILLKYEIHLLRKAKKEFYRLN